MLNWLGKLGGDPSEREIKKLRPYLAQANALDQFVRAYPQDAYDYAKLADAASRAQEKNPAAVAAEWFAEDR